MSADTSTGALGELSSEAATAELAAVIEDLGLLGSDEPDRLAAAERVGARFGVIAEELLQPHGESRIPEDQAELGA